MKQFIIDQMKEYQRKKEIVKAIQYEKGMEDGWIVEYPEYRDACETPIMMKADKIFITRSEAENYIEGANSIPVILTEISEEDYQDACFTIEHDGKYYMYNEVDEGYWITLDENGYIGTAYDTEDFFDEYELISNKSISKEQANVNIGYDNLRTFFIIGFLISSVIWLCGMCFSLFSDASLEIKIAVILITAGIMLFFAVGKSVVEKELSQNK